jgi:hypothetical protein
MEEEHRQAQRVPVRFDFVYIPTRVEANVQHVGTIEQVPRPPEWDPTEVDYAFVTGVLKEALARPLSGAEADYLAHVVELCQGLQSARW